LLSDVDPLAIELKKPFWKRRKPSGAANPNESYMPTTRGPNDPLGGFGDIVLSDERA
jgi:hypothetical protein